MGVEDYTYTNEKGEKKQGKRWKVRPTFLAEMGSEEKAVTSATKQLCGCMELMTGFAACIGGGRMGASTERDQDWRIGKARQCCNIKSLGTVGFGFSRADCQLGGGNSYNKRGKEAFLQAMETGREFAYQASPSYDAQAFEATTEEERDGMARRAIHPANVARACLNAHAKAEASLEAELDVCGTASSAPVVLGLREDVEATRVALEEADRVENLRSERISAGRKEAAKEAKKAAEEAKKAAFENLTPEQLLRSKKEALARWVKNKKQKRSDQTDTEKYDANKKRRDARAAKKQRETLYSFDRNARRFYCSSPESLCLLLGYIGTTPPIAPTAAPHAG
jgi:hypothetical protein